MCPSISFFTAARTSLSSAPCSFTLPRTSVPRNVSFGFSFALGGMVRREYSTTSVPFSRNGLMSAGISAAGLAWTASSKAANATARMMGLLRVHWALYGSG
jgi:hypothetical protein